MVLDYATSQFLEKVSGSASKARHLMTPQEARKAFTKLRGILSTGSEIEEVKDLIIPVPDGEALRCRLYIPSGASALLVYFHGGGWVVGGIEEFDPMCRDLASASGVAVALVEYRKAPEHPYPQPIEDAWVALNFMSQHCVDLTGCSLPLMVGGDSAGAHLAIATTLRSRDQSGPKLVGQLLIYPVTDSEFERKSYLAPQNQLMLTIETMKYYWFHFLPEEQKRQSPSASPCRFADLHGLPSAIVITAEHDVLLDEGEEYARRLIEAGVNVNFRRFPGQMHGFLMMRGILPGSDEGILFVGQALRGLISTEV